MTYHYHTNHKVLLGDLHTPVSTYLKVRDLFPQSALMESSDYHGSENNRSFIGLNPIASISVSHDVATAIYPDHSREETPISEACTVEDVMNRFLARFRVEGEYADYCGVYGYTSFNAVRYFEPVEVKDSTEAKNDAPDILYILYKYIIVFNDFKSEMVLIEMNDGSEPSHIGEIERAIHDRNYTTYGFHPIGETTSTLTDEAHKANIRKGIAHCLRGDVFQIVLSRRFIQHFQGDDFKLYRALRSINPSPYLFYFDFGGFRIFGSSPETHCRIEDGQATIDPIAGTTRRSGNKETDRKLTEALLADPKENAEHVMLVDLARNDLSRNCTGTHVAFYKEPRYPPREPGKRHAERRRQSHPHVLRHLSGRYIERCPQSTCHATHQRDRATQPRCIRRLHRLHRAERNPEPGHHHPHLRKPQPRTLVPGRRRHHRPEQRRKRTARSEQQTGSLEKSHPDC